MSDNILTRLLLINSLDLTFQMLSLVSYNLCGTHKLLCHEHILCQLRERDIVFVQESLNLQPTRLFPGFTAIERQAVVTKGRPSGGLSIFLKRERLGAALLSVLVSEAHLLAVLVDWPGECKLLLCNVYAPLQDRDEFYVNLQTQIAALVEVHVPSASIIAGDFNAHKFKPKRSFDHEFIAVAAGLVDENYSLYPVVKKPYTYVSGKSTSTIDYVFVRGLAVQFFEVGKVFIAQHRPLLMWFDLPAFSDSLHPSLSLGTAYWRSPAKAAEFPVALDGLGQTFMNVSSPHSLQEYYNKFLNIVSLFTKRTARKQPAASWESFLSQNDRQYLGSLRESTDKLVALADEEPHRRTEAQEMKKKLEVTTSQLLRKALDAETNRLTKVASSHVDAWQVLGKLRGSPAQCPIPTSQLVEHFSAIAKPEGTPLLPRPVPAPSDPTDDFEPLVPEELSAALRNVNQSSSAGPDGFSPREMCATFASGPAFEFLFNNLLAMCLVLSYVPLQWREATMFVLYKGAGDPWDANNYRAIALTSTFGKLYERVLLSRVLKWFRSSRIWLLPQFGFRAGSSCTHAIFLLRTLVLDVMDTNRCPVYLAFVDLRKAFPSLGRDALFGRMISLGVPYPLVAAIRAFYVSNVARLRVDNMLTKDFFVSIGVLEGSVLSPCLFGILFSVIWDLFVTSAFPTPTLRVYSKDSLWFIAYADDLVVVTLCKEKLQAVLNKMFVELKEMNLQMRCIF
jgi:hypothetical protein